jgi:hypothetical protein
MADRHVRGPSRARKHAVVATRPTNHPHDSAGGYERVRTTERVESDARKGPVDVYLAHHRALAIAWDVGACLPSADFEGVVDLSILDGLDVHHDAPEADAERGVEWDNREACLSVIDHDDHAALTNAERRAYAEDAKRLRDSETTPTAKAGCVECGDDPAARVAGERYCLDHATAAARESDETVEVI